MHIGQFSDTFFPIVDGVGRVVYNYANMISQKGHECYVIAPMADHGYLGGTPYEMIEFLSRNLPKQKQYQTGIPILDQHYNARIQNATFDILHAHSPFIAGQEALRLGKQRGVPVIGTFHSKYYDDFYTLTKAEALADIGVKYVVTFYEHCDEVWTVSQNSADTLHEYGYKGEIVVMPNGTPDVEPSEQTLKKAKDYFNLDDTPVLLYCGQLNWKKNLLRTLQAARLLMVRGRDFKLVMAGRGPDEAAIRERATEFGLENRLRFTGHLNDDTLLYGLYQASRLFVFPSLYDTSGMVVREAAANGTPSVVIRGSAPAEPITEGVNGLLCEDDPVSLAEQIDKTLLDPAMAQAMGENARATIYLPWSSVLDDVLIHYEDLIKRTACMGKK